MFGHHQDDQAETILFRLLRGSGVRGLAAMRACEPGRLRPLLGVRREEIVAYARAQGLSWVEDESNADSRFTRNFLRNEVLPCLERVFPAAVPALARGAENFAEADELLAELAELDGVACGGAVLKVEALQALPEPRLRNLLRARIHALGFDAPPRARLCEAVRQLREARGPALRIPLGELACCLYRGELWLETLAAEPPVECGWSGQAELPWGAGRVCFEETPGAGIARRVLAQGPVRLGARREGLKMRVMEGRPRRSFKNLCQEAGVPPWLRDRLPVLYVAGEPVWIAGVGLAPEAVCRADEPGILPTWRRS